MQHPPLLAALDLGSNSFRLELARHASGRLERETYFKETVRLGAGLDADGQLSLEVMERGWACLERFGLALRPYQPLRLRAVATQTLREAHNRQEFLARAERILDVPVELISGDDEARLISQGVRCQLPPEIQPDLIVDIGGRSTEVIAGPLGPSPFLHSFPMGCVSWSQRFFAQGLLTPAGFDAAEQAATALLAPCLPRIQAAMAHVHGPGPVLAYGAAGTFRALAKVLKARGGPADRIVRSELDALCEECVACGHVDALRLRGLKPDRKPVVGGGVSLMRALLHQLNLPHIDIARGALCDGVLWEMAHSTPQG